MHGVYDADNYAEISRTAGVYTRFSIRDSHADEECRGDFRGANRSTIVFKLGVLQDLRIFGGGGGGRFEILNWNGDFEGEGCRLGI